jgi:transcription elongation factor GreA
MDVQLVTQDGFDRMTEELGQLTAKRPEVSARIAEAREKGDLSENAEYHAAREEIQMIDAKIRHLEQRIKNSKIIKDGDGIEGRVNIGATVRVKDVKTGDEMQLQLLGDGEALADPTAEIMPVSLGSPLGEALFKAEVGSTVSALLPRGRLEMEILEIL